MADRAGTAPRLAAMHAVLGVLDGRSLEVEQIDPDGRLEARDRGLAAELAFGVCRWFRRLDGQLAGFMKRPLKARDRDVHVLLLLGLYQLRFSRVPPHAAIAASVECTRVLRKQWASGLVNGVLRSVQRTPPPVEDELPPGERYAQPDWFIDRLRGDWPDQWQGILGGMQDRPPMTLRVDLSRTDIPTMRGRLEAAGMTAATLDWAPAALQLAQPVAVGELPGFAEGLVSVQDAGAQLAAPLLDLQSGHRVLDACAAPGGKTLHLLEQAEGLELDALDIDAGRLERVAQNLARAGRAATLLTGDAAEPQGSAWGARSYDRILLDAPCSATGVMRRHPDIRLLRRATDIPALARRQAAILDALWPMLEPGGKLLYATCSVLAEENSAQIAAFMRRKNDATLVEPAGDWGVSAGPGRQTLPLDTSCDGFYYALLEKAS